MNGRLVALGNGAAMNGEGVDGVSFKNLEKVGELIMAVVTDTCFDGEFSVYGLSQ